MAFECGDEMIPFRMVSMQETISGDKQLDVYKRQRIGRAVDDHVRLLFPHGASDRIGIGDVQLGHVGEDVPVRAARRCTTHLAPELPVGLSLIHI